MYLKKKLILWFKDNLYTHIVMDTLIQAIVNKSLILPETINNDILNKLQNILV